jgi:hypothetical protein
MNECGHVLMQNDEGNGETITIRPVEVQERKSLSIAPLFYSSCIWIPTLSCQYMS